MGSASKPRKKFKKKKINPVKTQEPRRGRAEAVKENWW